MLEIGSEVEKYVVEAELGEGGMAHVFRVRHKTLGTLHALKVLKVQSAAIRERLVREGRVQAQLRHPNIVAVTDVIDVDGAPGLLMDFVAGRSLEEWLYSHRPTAEQAQVLFRGILAGVARAHRHGLIHRDLKPGNVLLEVGDEGELVPKVADFGLAKVMLDDTERMGATRSGVAMGTPSYMSPEQVRDAKNVDQRTDIFALGCILYELHCGQSPFAGPDVLTIFSALADGRYVPAEQVVPGLPPGVLAAIRACLAVDRDQRPADCAGILALLGWPAFGAVSAGGGSQPELSASVGTPAVPPAASGSPRAGGPSAPGRSGASAPGASGPVAGGAAAAGLGVSVTPSPTRAPPARPDTWEGGRSPEQLADSSTTIEPSAPGPRAPAPIPSAGEDSRRSAPPSSRRGPPWLLAAVAAVGLAAVLGLAAVAGAAWLWSGDGTPSGPPEGILADAGSEAGSTTSSTEGQALPTDAATGGADPGASVSIGAGPAGTGTPATATSATSGAQAPAGTPSALKSSGSAASTSPTEAPTAPPSPTVPASEEVTAPAATSTEKEVTSSGSDAKPVARAVQDATARADDLGKMIEEEVNLFGEDLFAGSSSSKVGRVRVIGEASVKLIDADKTRYDPGSSTPIGTYDVEATFPSGNVVLLRGLANVRSGRTVTLNCQARFETCTVR